jgi:4-amino-4-deoxychorismate lyase
MENGAKLLNIPFKGRDFVVELLENAISESKVSDAYVKICLLSDGKSSFSSMTDKSQLLVIIREYEHPGRSVNLKVNSFRKISVSPLRTVKSTNYIENVLARREALRAGFDEALFLNEWGEITECSASNIFWFKEGSFFTPHTNCGLLEGTTRNFIMDLVAEMNYSTMKGGFRIDDILTSDFVFITNSLIGSVPVSSLGDIAFDIEHPAYFEIQTSLINGLKWS